MQTLMSSKPKRQRKWHYSMPLHKVQARFSVHLSKELRKRLGKRSLEARKGDTVKVVRGSEGFVGKQGKITAVNRKKNQVFVENLTRKKMNGTEIQVPFRPSNLVLVTLDEKDSRRFKARGKKAKEPQKKEA